MTQSGVKHWEIFLEATACKSFWNCLFTVFEIDIQKQNLINRKEIVMDILQGPNSSNGKREKKWSSEKAICRSICKHIISYLWKNSDMQNYILLSPTSNGDCSKYLGSSFQKHAGILLVLFWCMGWTLYISIHSIKRCRDYI